MKAIIFKVDQINCGVEDSCVCLRAEGMFGSSFSSPFAVYSSLDMGSACL